MILPEVPVNYTRQSGYPKGSRSGGIDQLNDRFFISAEKFELSDLEMMEDQLAFEGMTVNASNWEVNENRNLVFVNVVYSEPGSAGLSAGATLGKPEYTLDDGGSEIPIDKRKKDGSLWFTNYKTKHNYILAAKSGVSATLSWWASNTDLTISDADSKNYKWLKDAGELPDGWYILKDKTKNIEAVIYPSPIVVATTYFKTYTQAINNVVEVGTVQTPGKTFGKSGQWLVTSCSISQDGRRWVIVTRYQNAPEWDSDYYSS
ncbi:MAG: hypothetical protein M0P69_13355 [Bacteroidales bacterium]|nr:hypothetical protein [Bacteroidales bacterium]